MAPVRSHGETIGGTQTYTLSLARELGRLGAQVTVIGTGPAGGEDTWSFVSVSQTPVRSNIEFHRALRRWCSRNTIERDTVVDAQRPDFLAPFIHERNAIALTSTLHGDPRYAIHVNRPFMSRAYERLERNGLHASERVISVSASAAGQYIARYPFLLSRIRVIPVGVDTTIFRPSSRDEARARLSLPQGPVVLYAGRLEAEKRVDTLLRAIEKMNRPPQVIIAGSGSLETKLRESAAGHPVRFLGRVIHAEMPLIMAAADALIIPSAFEGLPTVAVEAMACGLPVVATPTGDLPTIVKSGKTGFLFDGKPSSLARLLEENLPSMQTASGECVVTARAFAWERIARRVMEVLLEAAN